MADGSLRLIAYGIPGVGSWAERGCTPVPASCPGSFSVQHEDSIDHDFCDDLNAEQPRIGQQTPNAEKAYEVTSDELPMYCPVPDSSLWNGHPRVYIPLEEIGDEARCIYCGAVFRLVC